MNASSSITSLVGDQGVVSLDASAAISISINKALQGPGVVETGMVIDKVKVRYRYDASALAGNEYKQLHQFKIGALEGCFGKGGKMWLSPKAALTSVYQPIGIEGGLFVRYGCVHKKLWSWIDFNPAKLADDDMLVLRALLETLFTHGALTLIQRGQLARLDVAFDAHHARMQDYLFLDGRLRNIDCEREADGTIYFGSEHGKRKIVVYDKAKEQLEKLGVDVGHDWLRIEAKVRDPGRWDFSDIGQIPNPFEHFLVIEKQVWATTTDPALQALRTSVAAGMPLQNAYGQLPTPLACKQAWAALQQCRPPWWNPHEIWQGYEQTLGWIGPFLGEYVQAYLEPH